MKRSNFKLLQPFARRMGITLAATFGRVMHGHLEMVGSAIEQGENVPSVLVNMPHIIERDYIAAKGRVALLIAVQGYNLTGTYMEKASYIDSVMHAALSPRMLEQDIEEFFGHDALIANHIEPQVSEWVEQTSKYESATSAKQLQSLYEKAQTRGEGMPSAKLAKEYIKSGLAPVASRANMLARTLSSWSVHEGAATQYEDSGIGENEWMATLDEVTGEWDASLDGKIVPIRSPFVIPGEVFFNAKTGRIESVPFPVYHPPLHPNCRCTVLPVV